MHMRLSECRAHGPDEIMNAYLLHAISHISASAARIKKNNDALKAGRDPEACRDQGFTRAKVRCHSSPCFGNSLWALSCVLQVAFLPLFAGVPDRHHASIKLASGTLACFGNSCGR